MIASLTAKLTNNINEKLQFFKRQIVEEQSSLLDSAVMRFEKDDCVFMKGWKQADVRARREGHGRSGQGQGSSDQR